MRNSVSLAMGSCARPNQTSICQYRALKGRHRRLSCVIVLNECHLNRLMSEYIRYYHDDRTHLALEKGTPTGPTVARGLRWR